MIHGSKLCPQAGCQGNEFAIISGTAAVSNQLHDVKRPDFVFIFTHQGLGFRLQLPPCSKVLPPRLHRQPDGQCGRLTVPPDISSLGPVPWRSTIATPLRHGIAEGGIPCEQAAAGTPFNTVYGLLSSSRLQVARMRIRTQPGMASYANPYAEFYQPVDTSGMGRVRLTP